MKKYLVFFIIVIFASFSCSKKEEEPIAYEFVSTGMDTLIIGNYFTSFFYITSPSAKVSFYLEGPIENFKGDAGDFFFDNISDSLYIRDDMIFIKVISSFEKNDYNKKFWKISFDWVPTTQQIEVNKIYCFIIQSIWEAEGIPRTTWRNYIYMKGC